MHRRLFTKLMGASFLSLNQLSAWSSSWSSSPRMPVLFVGHGNPMNAIENNSFSQAWNEIGSGLPIPHAILVISAHWQTKGSRVTAMEHPKTIHDFYGFPPDLHAQQYPAPGHPQLAEQVAALATKHTIELDHKWGLDHGAWSVLLKMFPAATIPVLQLSMDTHLSPQQHFDLGAQLATLRDRGVLIIGSGNIVHNLRAMRMDGVNYDWAEEFDLLSAELILSRSFDRLIRFEELGTSAHYAIPTTEHYLPLLYSLSMLSKKDELAFFNESIDLGSVSMRSLVTR